MGLDYQHALVMDVICAGAPLELIQPDIMRFKAFEPVLLLGRARFANLDIRIRARGGGQVSQIYGEGLHAKLHMLHAFSA